MSFRSAPFVLGALLALLGVAAACSSDDASGGASGGAVGVGGQIASGGAPVGGQAPTGGVIGNGGTAVTGGVTSSTGGTTAGGAPSGGTAPSGGAGGESGGAAPASGGMDALGGSAGSGGAATGGTPGATGPLAPSAIGANETVGVEWTPQAGAEGYRIFYATGADATTADPFVDVTADKASFVHRGLENGTEYHYLVSALVGGTPSGEMSTAMATPGGEWALEELGSGIFEDVSTGQAVPRVPLEKRIHVMLFAEGYLADELPVFHDVASHDQRGNDVDRWVDEVFQIPPYSDFREAFVVWFLPRASNTHSDGGDTAFRVAVSGGGVNSVTDTAAPAWEAIGLHPIPPTDFSGGGFGTVRTHVAAFLVLSPSSGRAGVSGLTTSLRDPNDNQARISAAFAMGHAHEFTHAFSAVRDEYLENDNSAPQNTSDLSNVVGSNSCGELPWAHLLEGGGINPGTSDLVGAFGVPSIGYHSEFLCLMNGTHDNASYYGGNGTLRTDTRMCNFCRELAAYFIYARSSILPINTSGFDEWKASYRDAYFQQFPFFVPDVVPQTNDVRNPAQGMPYYEACTQADVAQALEVGLPVPAPSGPRRSGCVIEE